MKKPIVLAAALIAIDQAIKLIILRCGMDARQTLIPGVLYFRPVRNTNLNWVSSMADVTPPVWLMVALQLLLMALVVLAYRYMSFRSRESGGLLAPFFSLAAAGIGCSFVDVVFWGGSLDFLGLFDWFVFDTKDLFLNASWIVFALREIRREKTSAESKPAKIALREWFRLGCPM